MAGVGWKRRAEQLEAHLEDAARREFALRRRLDHVLDLAERGEHALHVLRDYQRKLERYREVIIRQGSLLSVVVEFLPPDASGIKEQIKQELVGAEGLGVKKAE